MSDCSGRREGAWQAGYCPCSSPGWVLNQREGDVQIMPLNCQIHSFHLDSIFITIEVVY